jgi:hypothetical protein
LRRQKFLTWTAPEKEAAFWEKVQIGEPNECWPWTGGRSGDGYGVHRLRDYFRSSSHRIAYALANRAEPAEMHVCHHCDNPLCCNPSHLFLGDAKANAQDKVRKGRARGRFSKEVQNVA